MNSAPFLFPGTPPSLMGAIKLISVIEQISLSEYENIPKKFQNSACNLQHALGLKFLLLAPIREPRSCNEQSPWLEQDPATSAVSLV